MIARPPSLKKPFRLSVSRISIGGCYLFEILEKTEIYFMIRDSEGTLCFTHGIQSKDYLWEVSLPVVLSTRNKYVLELTLFDRILDFGEKLLSPVENSQVLRVRFELAELANTFGVLESKAIEYSEQFRKYAKKLSLMQPQSTKSFNNMVEQKSAVVKVEYCQLQSFEYSEACITLLNAKITSADVNTRLQLSLGLNGVHFQFPTQLPNTYVLR